MGGRTNKARAIEKAYLDAALGRGPAPSKAKTLEAVRAGDKGSQFRRFGSAPVSPPRKEYPVAVEAV